MVGAGAMAVLVQPHSMSHQVYCVPAAPVPVATAVAGISEVLWQPHSGSHTVTVTIDAGAEIRVASPVIEAFGIIVPVGNGVLEDADTLPAGTMTLNRGEKSIDPF